MPYNCKVSAIRDTLFIEVFPPVCKRLNDLVKNSGISVDHIDNIIIDDDNGIILTVKEKSEKNMVTKLFNDHIIIEIDLHCSVFDEDFKCYWNSIPVKDYREERFLPSVEVVEVIDKMSYDIKINFIRDVMD